MAQTTADTDSFDVCPLALAENENVVQFANVDGTAFIFANHDTGHVRTQLDKIYSDSELSFETARPKSVVESKTNIDEIDEVSDDYDMVYIYSREEEDIS